MKEITINKVSILNDGRLAIYPAVISDIYEYIYRAACGVYWNNDESCFQSTIPKDMTHNEWYGQILSVVRSELGIKMNLTNETIFESNTSKFKEEIILQNEQAQQWMAEQDKIQGNQ